MVASHRVSVRPLISPHDQGAIVQVRWSSFTIQARGTSAARFGPEIVDGLQTTTDGEGYYRICSVPERELLTVIGIHEGVESAGDTLRIEEFAAARVHMLDIERERR